MHPATVEMLAQCRQADMEREIRGVHLLLQTRDRRPGMAKRFLGVAGRWLIHAGTWLNRQAGETLNGGPNAGCRH